MRREPTLRIPLGILALLFALALYAMLVASASEYIGRLHVLVQAVVYLILGTVWLLPLRRYLIWMETGRWSAPDEGEPDESTDLAGKNHSDSE